MKVRYMTLYEAIKKGKALETYMISKYHKTWVVIAKRPGATEVICTFDHEPMIVEGNYVFQEWKKLEKRLDDVWTWEAVETVNISGNVEFTKMTVKGTKHKSVSILKR